MLGFVASPFEKMPVVPANGSGLNPLLYDLGMLYHPPMLLAGYMSWTIPFAFAVAALAHRPPRRRLDQHDPTLRAGRLGDPRASATCSAPGGRTACSGWGGYWGWDPVENSAIMPWLIGTAFIHSIMIQERRGMLKVWNMALVMVTFYLAIFGTFVVRSGVINSVHSFAQSAIGPYFLAFLTLVVGRHAGAAVLAPAALRSDNQLDSMLSREASFLLNNLLFLGLVFAIFWGTIFPLVSEAVQGTQDHRRPAVLQPGGRPDHDRADRADGHRAADAVAQGPRRDACCDCFGPPVAVRHAGRVRCDRPARQGSTSRRRSPRSAPAGSSTATIATEVVRGTLARHQATGENVRHRRSAT